MDEYLEAGKKITISEKILEVHPKSPLAGKTLSIVTLLTEQQKAANAVCEQFGERNDLIPVNYGGTVWYVEPEFVVIK